MKTVGMAVAVAIVAAGAALPGKANADISDKFTFGGFGTFGLVTTNTDQAQFGRDRQLGGADKSVDAGVDSNLGLQLSFQATDWLSATVQGLAVKRDDSTAKLEPEWAFIKVQPVDGLSVRVGRMPLPTFVVSDSRNVGYANTWLRAPNEVYGLNLLRRMDGADVTYRHSFGAVGVSATVLAGDSEMRVLGSNLAANKVRGANVQVEVGPVALRAGRAIADVYVSSTDPESRYEFTGFGVTVNQGNFIGQAEYVERRPETLYYNIAAADGWYAMGGYRFGSVTPYLIYSNTDPKYSATAPQVQMLYPLISSDQKTFAVGMRWDATDFAAVKFQAERVDTNGTPGISFSRTDAPAPALRFATPVTKKVNVLSATIDFVF